MLQGTTSGGVAPEQFAWSEQFGSAAATAYGSWPMGQPPFVPPAIHAAVASTATNPAALLPLPVRCTPYHPPLSSPRAASLTDSAMAMGGLARSVHKASKTTVASGSNYGHQAPTDGTHPISERDCRLVVSCLTTRRSDCVHLPLSSSCTPGRPGVNESALVRY